MSILKRGEHIAACLETIHRKPDLSRRQVLGLFAALGDALVEAACGPPNGYQIRRVTCDPLPTPPAINPNERSGQTDALDRQCRIIVTGLATRILTPNTDPQHSRRIIDADGVTIVSDTFESSNAAGKLRVEAVAVVARAAQLDAPTASKVSLEATQTSETGQDTLGVVFARTASDNWSIAGPQDQFFFDTAHPAGVAGADSSGFRPLSTEHLAAVGAWANKILDSRDKWVCG